MAIRPEAVGDAGASCSDPEIMAQRVAVRIDYHLLTNGPSLFILPFWFRQAQHQVWLAWIVDGLRHSGWPQARVGIESGMLVLRFV